jgi:hypothetical protein
MQVELCEIPLVENAAYGAGACETGDPPAGWGVQAKRGQSLGKRRRLIICFGQEAWGLRKSLMNRPDCFLPCALNLL